MRNINWTNIAVVGAAGKMGRGISLLLMQEMARREAETFADSSTGKYCLYLIDANEEAVYSLRRVLHPKLFRYAEKRINRLRNYYEKNEKLVSNEEMIHCFVQGALDLIRPDTELKKLSRSSIVFESIEESVSKKIELYSKLKEICDSSTLFFTNTSSIPITFLNEETDLGSRILGFHFYNPPEQQKLVEVVVSKQAKEIVHEIASSLQKTAVFSKDVSGFIGNGFFIREIAFACNQVERLTKTYPYYQAIAIIDQVTREFLLRPMGIFQLIDFVGIDVCSKIAKIMGDFLNEDFSKELVSKMIQKGIQGGQQLDGTPKDGFFRYRNGKPEAIYSLETGAYQPIPDHLEKLVGKRPELNDEYFETLKKTTSLGAELARIFWNHSTKIAHLLVDRGAANCLEDVDTVLKLGFRHQYGPSEIGTHLTQKE